MSLEQPHSQVKSGEKHFSVYEHRVGQRVLRIVLGITRSRTFVEIRQNTDDTPQHSYHSLGVQNATLVLIYSQEGLFFDSVHGRWGMKFFSNFSMGYQNF